jgi:hypothetical protein
MHTRTKYLLSDIHIRLQGQSSLLIICRPLTLVVYLVINAQKHTTHSSLVRRGQVHIAQDHYFRAYPVDRS